jgi:hypothetical protein
MLTKRRQLAAKIEAEEGVEETLASEDAKLLVENPVVDVDPPLHERNPVGSSFSKVGDIPGKRASRLTFSLCLKGSGVPTTEPEWFKLLKACGWQVTALHSISIGAITSGPFLHGETITGGTSGATGRVVMETADGTVILYYVVLSGTFQDAETISGETSGASTTSTSDPQEAGKELRPLSASGLVPSLSMATYEDGLKKLLKGARGKVKLNFKVGEPVVLDFDFSGAYKSISDVSLLSSVVHETTKPPVFLNASLSIESLQAKISELEIDWANVLGIRDDVNDPGGVFSYIISDRKPVGSFNPEMVSVSSHDFFGKWFAGEEMVLRFMVGEASGNKFLFYAPKTQYSKVADEDREGIATARTSFSLNGTLEPGDDELAILCL